MARYRPSSYRSRRGRTRSRIYYVIVAILLVAGFLLINSFRNNDQAEEESAQISDSAEAVVQAESPDSAVAATAETTTPVEVSPVESQAEKTDEALPEQANAVPSPEPVVALPNAPDSSEVTALIAEAQQDIFENRIIEARDKLNDALGSTNSPRQRQTIKRLLSELADKWLFSRETYSDDPLCSRYQVRPGEVLSNIAKDHKVPYQILMQVNNIDRANALRAGKTIKVVNGPFHAIVHRSSFTLDLYLQNTFVGSFGVGLGKPGRETPTGLWRVEAGGKLVRPRWTDPDTGKTYLGEDPDYPLGARWIGIEGMEGPAKGRNGFALHGTNDPEQIGTMASRGCIRLHNEDVIMLYNVLAPAHSEVRVID